MPVSFPSLAQAVDDDMRARSQRLLQKATELLRYADAVDAAEARWAVRGALAAERRAGSRAAVGDVTAFAAPAGAKNAVPDFAGAPACVDRAGPVATPACVVDATPPAVATPACVDGAGLVAAPAASPCAADGGTTGKSIQDGGNRSSGGCTEAVPPQTLEVAAAEAEAAAKALGLAPGEPAVRAACLLRAFMCATQGSQWRPCTRCAPSHAGCISSSPTILKSCIQSRQTLHVHRSLWQPDKGFASFAWADTSDCLGKYCREYWKQCGAMERAAYTLPAIERRLIPRYDPAASLGPLPMCNGAITADFHSAGAMPCIYK
eukprot:353973-Chlamydomonas_euryale.AAC.2